jgi:hypothetical protein
MKVDLEKDDVFEKYIEATGRRAWGLSDCRQSRQAWSMGHGAWSMGHGAWSMGYGACLVLK